MAPHCIVRKRPNCRRQCFPSSCRENACVAAITVDDVCEAFDRVAAGDGVIAPVGGRRYWAALSLSVLVHAPDDSRAADVMEALRLLRRAGFIDYTLACRQEDPLDKQARAEGFESRAADATTLFDAIVEFGGGVVYDFANHETGGLRMAMSVARRMGSGARRVWANDVPTDADALTDALLTGASHAVR
jgi:hypothetical protein